MRKNAAVSFVSVCLLMVLADFGIGQNKMSVEMSRPVAMPVPLELSETVEREINGGASHLFKIRLAAGQFVKIEAEQFGCDIMIVLNSPEKINVFEMKDDNYQNGKEIQTAAVAAAGDYELKIVSFEAAEQKGRYTLKIAEIRAATEKELAETKGFSIVNSLNKKIKVGSATSEQIRESIRELEIALESFRYSGNRRFEATVLSGIGSLKTRLGDLRGAIELQQKSLEIYRGLGADEDMSVLLSNIGTAYWRKNEPQKALDFLYESAAIAERREDDFNHSRALNLIGVVFENLGDPARAHSFYTRALGLAEKIRQDNFIVDSNLNLGRTTFSGGDFKRAADYFQTAVAVSRRIGNKRQTASALGSLGQVLFETGERPKALELLAESMSISRELGDKIAEASALRRFGKVQLVLDDVDQAAASFAAAAEIYRSLEDSGNLAETLLLSARTAFRKGDIDAALKTTENACEMIEQIRARVNSNELRDSFSANLQDYYEFYVELLMVKHQKEPSGGFAARAFEASERARARGLLNLLAESNVDFGGGDAKLHQRETELSNLLAARLENLTKVLNGKNDAGQVAALRTEVERYRIELAQIRVQIRKSDPRYAALTQPVPLTLTEVQKQVVDRDSVLLEYSLGEKRSFLFVVTSDAIEAIELPGRARIEKTARLAHDALTARNRHVKFETADEFRARAAFADTDYLTYSKDLSGMIVGPVAARIKDRRILVVADGALQYLPFGALQLGDKFLAETNEIVNLPSASVLGVLRRETAGRSPAGRTIAVFADPIFEKSDERLASAVVKSMKPESRPVSLLSQIRGDAELPRLPFTRREAEFVGGLVPPEQRSLRLDADANRQNVLSTELSGYRYVHFATHGYINSQVPELSGIVLSLFDRNGGEQNGFLSLGDMYNLRLNAEMVVLSGCRTGLGREIVGEGLVGLTRGFLFAGARRVTVSLWDVNDEATSELMKRFYREMLSGRKLAPAAALRQAQVSMMRETKWNSPYYWASFVMQGEPR